MSTPTIPTPQDAQLLLANITRTTSYSSDAIDLGDGFAPMGQGRAVAAVIDVSAIDTVTGNETYSFALEHSDDGAIFTACTVTTAASATGVIAVAGRARKRYIRLGLTLAGTTPSITFRAWLNPLP